MMNVANKERTSPPLIDFQLRSIGKYDQPRQRLHMEMLFFSSSVLIARLRDVSPRFNKANWKMKNPNAAKMQTSS